MTSLTEISPGVPGGGICSLQLAAGVTGYAPL
jgi:hypothetical protein